MAPAAGFDPDDPDLGLAPPGVRCDDVGVEKLPVDLPGAVAAVELESPRPLDLAEVDGWQIAQTIRHRARIPARSERLDHVEADDRRARADDVARRPAPVHLHEAVLQIE